MVSYLLVLLGHCVKGAAVLEPLDLGFVEGVVKLDLEGITVLGVHFQCHGLANSELSAEKVNLVENISILL